MSGISKQIRSFVLYSRVQPALFKDSANREKYQNKSHLFGSSDIWSDVNRDSVQRLYKNIKNMRQFYESWNVAVNRQPTAGDLDWHSATARCRSSLPCLWAYRP